MQQQYRIYHWQTKATDANEPLHSILKKLDEKIEALIELSTAKHEVSVAAEFEIEIAPYQDSLGCVGTTNAYMNFLTNEFPSVLKANDLELAALKDEVLASLDELKNQILAK